MIERDETWPEVSFSDRMNTVDFKVDDKPHIVVDGGIVFNYEQCFECGTCYLVCNNEGAISWSYPEGGYGVIFRTT